MTKLFLLFILSFAFTQNVFAESCNQKIAVFVPGFFNNPKFLPSGDGPNTERKKAEFYFSDVIFNTAKENGYLPIYIKGLDPVGTFEKNGSFLLNALEALEGRYPGCPFTVIAHSAGGIYTAYALTKNPILPISTVITIATPYNGSDVADMVSYIPGWDSITSNLNLQSLQQFESKNMPGILASLNVPQRVRWIALATAQPTCFLYTCKDARTQLWFFSFLWQFSRNQGDGLVSVNSSLAVNSNLNTPEGAVKQIERWNNFIIPMDHFEVTQQPEKFYYFGVTNVSWIRKMQKKVYEYIFSQI